MEKKVVEVLREQYHKAVKQYNRAFKDIKTDPEITILIVEDAMSRKMVIEDICIALGIDIMEVVRG